jgi:predicted AlkP superfamily pyrophosphatase or phosphodiesterase
MERDEKLDRAYRRFVNVFEIVFKEDWEHSKGCLQNIDAYVAPGGTFLNPLQDDEDANWSARKSLLEAYRDVVEVMNARGIYDEEPPGFGQPPPDTEK